MPTSATDETAGQTARSRPERMQPLATLPVFFKLSGKRAIVVGSGEAALWKVELLVAAGALVDVYAETISTEFETQLPDWPAGTINIVRRVWTPEDLAGAAIAIGACEDDHDAAAFACAARAAGVPVNIVDRPAFCDFQFAAIVNRSPLVVAISTDGAAPVLAQTIRSMIEALLPDGLKRWGAAAKVWRSKGDELGATPAARRRFWDRFAERAMREAQRPPTDDDLTDLLSASDSEVPSIAIVDVGDTVETLSLGALRLLRNADVIVYDEAIPLVALDFARREAQRFTVSEDAAGIARSHEAAQRGKRVVRLMSAHHGGAHDRHREFLRALDDKGLTAMDLTVAILSPTQSRSSVLPSEDAP